LDIGAVRTGRLIHSDVPALGVDGPPIIRSLVAIHWPGFISRHRPPIIVMISPMVRTTHGDRFHTAREGEQKA
jgi:hypothetical protein